MNETWWKLSVTTLLGFFFLTLCLFPSKIDILKVAIGILIIAGIHTRALDKNFFLDPILFGIGAFTLIAMASSASGAGDLSKSFRISTWALPFVLGKAFSKTHPYKLMNTLLLGAVLLGAYMLCALAIKLLGDTGLLNFTFQNLTLTFRSETRTALFIAIGSFICLYQIFSNAKLSHIHYYVLTFSVLFIALIVSGKRITLAALLATSTFLLVIRKKILFIMIIFIATAISIVIIGQSQRFSLSPDHLFASQGVIERQTVWYAAWKLISENPLLGTGFSSFKKESQPYIEEYRKTIPKKFEFEKLEDAHNIILHICAETGVLGLSAILFLFFAACRHTWIHREDNQAALCLCACLLIISIHLQLHAHLASTNVSGLVFLLMGFSMGISKKNT